MKVLVIYHDELSKDRDFLFESQCSYDLDAHNDDDIYAHIMNINLSKMQVRNASTKPIILARRFRLETITKYNQAKYYLAMSNDNYKTINEWMIEKSWKRHLTHLVATIVTIAVVYVNIAISLSSLSKTVVALSRTSSTKSSRNVMRTSWSNIFVSQSTSSTLIISISQLDSRLEHTLFNDVTIYEENLEKLVNLMSEYQEVFEDSSITMNILEKK